MKVEFEPLDEVSVLRVAILESFFAEVDRPWGDLAIVQN